MESTGATDPAHVLVAGDTVLDVRAGRAAGAGFVDGVLTGARTRDEPAAENAGHLLAGVREIPGLLRARPPQRCGRPPARQTVTRAGRCCACP
jgi:phosphoglycolate phosphatase